MDAAVVGQHHEDLLRPTSEQFQLADGGAGLNSPTLLAVLCGQAPDLATAETGIDQPFG